MIFLHSSLLTLHYNDRKEIFFKKHKLLSTENHRLGNNLFLNGNNNGWTNGKLLTKHEKD